MRACRGRFAHRGRRDAQHTARDSGETGMKVKDIAAVVERIAPLGLAQSWDNVGLLVGDRERDLKSVLLTIDVTKAVVAEAKRLKADLILSYHPVIWDGLKQILE